MRKFRWVLIFIFIMCTGVIYWFLEYLDVEADDSGADEESGDEDDGNGSGDDADASSAVP